jgi:hypothetical protein
MAGGGFSITISAVDKASSTLEAVNKRLQKFNAPIDRLRKNFEKFSDLSGLSKIGGALTEVARKSLEAFQAMSRMLEPLAAITGALTVAGMYRLASAWGNFGTILARNAARTNQSADQLHALQGAARLSGASAESLTEGMKTLGDTLVDAVGGRAPEAVVIMRSLGLEFRNTDGTARKASAVLPELADRIARLQTPTLRARAATQMLGGAAEELMPFILRGAAGIQELTEAARFYGVINDKGAASAMRFREAQTRLALAAEGLGNSIAERLAPVLEPLIRRFADWIALNRDWIATGITERVGEFAAFLERIDWPAVGRGVEQFGAGVQEVVGFLGGWMHAAEILLAFTVGKWAIGMLGSIARTSVALTELIALQRIAAGGTLGAAAIGTAGLAVGGGAGVMLAAGAYSGANELPMVDDFGRVIGNWGGKDESQNPAAVDAIKPRGIRNNNPLNLSYVPGQQGVIDSDGRFGRYGSMQEGIAASQRQLMRYQDQGYTTISQMVSRWAPAGENKTADYIAAVARQTGLDPNLPIDMRDPAIASKVIRAMGRQEVGSDLDAGTVAQGVALALGRPVDVASASAIPAAPSGQATITVRDLTGPRTGITASSSGDLFNGAPKIESALVGR